MEVQLECLNAKHQSHILTMNYYQMKYSQYLLKMRFSKYLHL